MKTSELIKLLKKHGVEFVAHGKKHDIYRNPKTGETFPIPRHKDEIAKSTLNSILKSAGLK